MSVLSNQGYTIIIDHNQETIECGLPKSMTSAQSALKDWFLSSKIIEDKSFQRGDVPNPLNHAMCGVLFPIVTMANALQKYQTKVAALTEYAKVISACVSFSPFVAFDSKSKRIELPYAFIFVNDKCIAWHKLALLALPLTIQNSEINGIPLEGLLFEPCDAPREIHYFFYTD
jgi:hypothetical protein